MVDKDSFSASLGISVEERHAVVAQMSSEDLWDMFVEHFSAGLRDQSVGKELLRERASTLRTIGTIWNSRPDRTAYYQHYLLEHIASQFSLTYGTELFRIDSSMSVTHGAQRIPLIHVESENNADMAHEEVDKLCAFQARLKVLVTCARWNPDRGAGSRAHELLKLWRSRIVAQHAIFPQDCVYGLIVGDRFGRSLDFYATVLSRRPRGRSHGRKIWNGSSWTKTW
jgi:hypothetical protein